MDAMDTGNVPDRAWTTDVYGFAFEEYLLCFSILHLQWSSVSFDDEWTYGQPSPSFGRSWSSSILPFPRLEDRRCKLPCDLMHARIAGILSASSSASSQHLGPDLGAFEQNCR
jgi:hypothetical protein